MKKNIPLMAIILGLFIILVILIPISLRDTINANVTDSRVTGNTDISITDIPNEDISEIVDNNPFGLEGVSAVQTEDGSYELTREDILCSCGCGDLEEDCTDNEICNDGTVTYFSCD